MESKIYYDDILPAIVFLVCVIFGILIGILWQDSNIGILAFLCMLMIVTIIIIIREEMLK